MLILEALKPCPHRWIYINGTHDYCVDCGKTKRHKGAPMTFLENLINSFIEFLNRLLVAIGIVRGDS